MASLSEAVRAHCAAVAGTARHVRIDLDRIGDIAPGPQPELDPVRHFLEGTRDEVVAYLLTLTAINFGSGWFPTLRKRVVAGKPVSGYFTVAMGLTDRFRALGPYANEELRSMRTEEIAATLGQRPGHELMALYAQALRQLGTFLGDRTPRQLAGGGSAQGLAAELARMSMWNDVGFYKRAQILPNDLALAGVAEFADLDTLTIFADNLVPHVLRTDGVLIYDDDLARQVESGRPLTDARMEREIRACAVFACAHIAQRLGVPERIVDMRLWNRGQDPRYKALPRHRARTVFY